MFVIVVDRDVVVASENQAAEAAFNR